MFYQEHKSSNIIFGLCAGRLTEMTFTWPWCINDIQNILCVCLFIWWNNLQSENTQEFSLIIACKWTWSYEKKSFVNTSCRPTEDYDKPIYILHIRLFNFTFSSLYHNIKIIIESSTKGRWKYIKEERNLHLKCHYTPLTVNGMWTFKITVYLL